MTATEVANEPMRPIDGGPTARHPMVPDALVRACCEGDRAAYAQLFELCRDRVYSVALHFTGDPVSAADISQEVFVRLLTRIGQFRFECQFTSWLYRIVANVAMDHGRLLRRLTALDGHAVPDAVPALQERAWEARQREIDVRRAILQLSPKLKVPVILRYVEGLSYEQIAEVLSISPGTVASRLSRAHARLARTLNHLR